MDEWYPIQVKQTAKVGRPDIDAFEAVMMREERMLGYFVGFEFTGDALFEIDRFRRKEGREIWPLTVRELSGRRGRDKARLVDGWRESRPKAGSSDHNTYG